jgi:uncharacterized protein YozE (UPF0346 family)
VARHPRGPKKTNVMSKFNTFYEWLEKQKNRKSPLGDLAAEASRDPSFPKDVASLDALLAHLRTKASSGAAIATARLAWQTYARGQK